MYMTCAVSKDFVCFVLQCQLCLDSLHAYVKGFSVLSLIDAIYRGITVHVESDMDSTVLSST